MNTDTGTQTSADAGAAMAPLRLVALTALAPAAFAVLVFWPAGSLTWIRGWLYVAVVAINFGVNVVYLNRVNPVLIMRRLSVGPGTKRWDTLWSACFGPVMLAIYVVAGFDAVRYGWSSMPGWLWPLGLAVFLPGTVLFSWAMGVNPFFEKTVRIQTERGHHVVHRGPYRFVRHPGYAGFLGWALSAPLLLGSWWAFVPAVLSIAALVVRTALEDRTLRSELDGYADYAVRVRYRLIPGVW